MEMEGDHKAMDEIILDMDKAEMFSDLNDTEVVLIEKDTITKFVKDNIEYISGEKSKEGVIKTRRNVTLFYV